MASVEHMFKAFQKEYPNHSSLINFVRAVKGHPLTKRRVVFYFRKCVEKGDYESSTSKELTEWIYSKHITQKQGFFDKKVSKSALVLPQMKQAELTYA